MDATDVASKERVFVTVAASIPKVAHSKTPAALKQEQKVFARESQTDTTAEGSISSAVASFSHLDDQIHVVERHAQLFERHANLVRREWGDGNIGLLDLSLTKWCANWIFELRELKTDATQGLYVSFPHGIQLRTRPSKNEPHVKKQLKAKLDTFMVVARHLRSKTQGLRLFGNATHCMHEAGIDTAYAFVSEPRSINAMPVLNWYRVLHASKAHHGGYQIDGNTSRTQLANEGPDQLKRTLARLALRYKSSQLQPSEGMLRATVFADWSELSAKTQKRICVVPTSEQEWMDVVSMSPMKWRTLTNPTGNKVLGILAYRAHNVYIPTVNAVAPSAQLCFFECCGHKTHASSAMRGLLHELQTEQYLALHGVSMGDVGLVQDEAKCLVYGTSYLDFYNFRLCTKTISVADFSVMYI